MRKIITIICALSMSWTSYADVKTVVAQNNKILIKTNIHDGQEWRSFQFCNSTDNCQPLGKASEYPVSWLKEAAHAHFVKIATSSLKDAGLVGAALVTGYFVLGGVAIAGGVLTEAGGAVIAGSTMAAIEPAIKELNPMEQFRAAKNIEEYGVRGNSLVLKNNDEVQKVAACLDWALTQYKK